MDFTDRVFIVLKNLSEQLGRRLSEVEWKAAHRAEYVKALKEKKKSAVLPEAEQVYELFPKKVGKEDALRAISAALKKHPIEYLLDKTNQFAEAVRSWPSSYRYFQDGGDRCPHPASWYNAGRYADDPKEWRRQGARSGATHQHVSPPEPQNWRESFPEFVDRDKPWNLLQPAQQQFIIANMATSQHFSEPVENIQNEQWLREA